VLRKMEWEQLLEKWMGFCVVGWQRRRKWGNRLENERKWSADWSGAAAVKGEENSQPGGGDSREKDGFRVRFFFFVFFLDVVKITPPGFELKAAIYRQNIFRALKLVPQFLCLAPNFN